MASECTPVLAMVLVQLCYACLNVVSKLALDSGMSPFVMIAYRQLVAAIALAPVAFFQERKTCMKITGALIFQIFWCALFGATGNQLLYFIGLKYSTPTMACALSNMLPAITFILAVPLRMEMVGIKTVAGLAKLTGTTLCVGGSIFMTLYRGPLIHLLSSPIHWKYVEDVTTAASGGGQGPAAAGQNMALGAVLVILSSVSWAVWFIIQAKMSKSFPSPYTTSTILSFFAGVQCFAIGAAAERDLSRWALRFDIGLVTIIFAGLACSGLAVVIMSWCIAERGPLFISMFSPLVLIIVAVLGWAILDEKLNVGSVTGSVLIAGGLYLVVWGKGREMITNNGGRIADVELAIHKCQELMEP